MQDKAGNTPLHEAAKGLHTSTIQLMLEKKADKSRKNKKNQIFTDLVCFLIFLNFFKYFRNPIE